MAVDYMMLDMNSKQVALGFPRAFVASLTSSSSQLFFFGILDLVKELVKTKTRI